MIDERLLRPYQREAIKMMLGDRDGCLDHFSGLVGLRVNAVQESIGKTVVLPYKSLRRVRRASTESGEIVVLDEGHFLK